MDVLQHDPRTKQKLRDYLYEFLYSPMKEYFYKRLSEIVVANARIIKNNHMHFMYKGQLYNLGTSPLPIRKNRLDASLHSQMKDYLEEVNDFEQEELPLTLGYITTVLNSTDHFCDYYELFPKVLHEPLKEYADTCPCKTCMLPKEQIESLKAKNQHIIDMIKMRRVMNLTY